MKSKVFSLFFLALFLVTFQSFEINKAKIQDSFCFSMEEKLHYDLSYGIVKAGTAEISVQEHKNKNLIRFVGKGKTTKSFDFFFKVRDHYESWWNVKNKLPVKFIRDVREGSYKKKQVFKFYQKKKVAVLPLGDTMNLHHSVQDLVSLFYFARLKDIYSFKPGDSFIVNSFIDHEEVPVKITYEKDEAVKVGEQFILCSVFIPVVQQGRIFNDDNALRLYVSKDKNKIPVKVTADILVGSLKMELTKYSGLKYPLALK